jgi:hypothetical protein
MNNTERIILVILLGIPFIVYQTCTDLRKEESINKIALNDLNLHLVGVVTNVDKLNGYNGTGVIDLKILNSNIQEYDPRPNQFYYCIIKNGIAEVYDGLTDYLFEGDTVCINTEKRTIVRKSMVKEKLEGTIWVNSNKGFYDYIKKYHQKF